jgi:hypothetical protein
MVIPFRGKFTCVARAADDKSQMAHPVPFASDYWMKIVLFADANGGKIRVRSAAQPSRKAQEQAGMPERKETKRVGGFQAVASDGRTYTIVEDQVFVHVTFLSEPPQTIPGSRSFRLSTGGPVNMVNESEFEIVASGTRVRRTA